MYLGLQANTYNEFIQWDDVLFTTPAADHDFCASAPCQNNATCSTPLYRYRYQCTCRDGFEGRDCEYAVYNECISSPCQSVSTQPVYRVPCVSVASADRILESERCVVPFARAELASTCCKTTSVYATHRTISILSSWIAIACPFMG